MARIARLRIPTVQHDANSNTGVNDSDCPANGMCQIQKDNRIHVPFHLISHALHRINESYQLNQLENAFPSSLLEFSFDLEHIFLANKTKKRKLASMVIKLYKIDDYNELAHWCRDGVGNWMSLLARRQGLAL